MSVLLAILLMGGPTVAEFTPPLGPISIDVGIVKKNRDDVLSVRLTNNGDLPVEIDLRHSPCSSTELATLAFVGDGAVGSARERVGIVEYAGTQKIIIAAHGVHSCTFSISSWYEGRWKPSDRSYVRIFWSFEALGKGVYNKTLYGGVVRLP